MTLEDSLVCIVGLGYVGLPLAQAFAQKLKVIGFDLDKQKVFTLHSFPGDRPLTTDNQNNNLTFAANPEKIKPADFFTICVPTPVTKAKFPDLSSVEYAARIVGANMPRNSTVILESTVYPGVTEEVVKAIENIQRDLNIALVNLQGLDSSKGYAQLAEKKHGLRQLYLKYYTRSISNNFSKPA